MYPTMTYRKYIIKYALETRDGKFFCKLCNNWINHQRWIHFSKLHRYVKAGDKDRKISNTQVSKQPKS